MYNIVPPLVQYISSHEALGDKIRANNTSITILRPKFNSITYGQF